MSGSKPGGLRGPNGETLCWYECTVQGGRKGSGLDVVQLATAVEALGCGELLLNCIDNDGQNDGYDLHLTRSVRATATASPAPAPKLRGCFAGTLSRMVCHAVRSAPCVCVCGGR